MKASFAILLLFLTGVAAGRFLPMRWLLDLDPSLPALWLLMALVGFSLGAGPQFQQMLAAFRLRLILLPVFTTLGTFCGAIVAACLVSWSVFDCLAIGSGFAYYSLSSVFISRFRGADPGSAALICNVLRELFTLLFVPLIVRFFGPIAAISSGGATTMDTTLPVIVRYAGSQWAMPAIFHAMILDISVPFWVSLFCGLGQRLAN